MATKNGTEPESRSEEEWKKQELEDARLMAAAMDHANSADGASGRSALYDFENSEIDQRGKAEDAIDFEDMDLSDDELPDEEPSAEGAVDLPDLAGNDEDLFGDADPSPHLPADFMQIADSSPLPTDYSDNDDEVDGEGKKKDDVVDLRELMRLNFDNYDDHERGDNQDPNIPPVAENLLETVKQIWPSFEENGILDWNELLPVKEATWIAKKPHKPPRPLVPSKLSLDVDIDQEKLFRIPGPARYSVWQRIRDAEARGLICLEEPEPVQAEDLEAFDLDDESDAEAIGGYTLRDIATLCDDWDSLIEESNQLVAQDEPMHVDVPIKDEDEDAAWEREFLDEPAPKKRKFEAPHGLPEITRFIAPNFDHFEEATAKLGRHVILDMNDPYLLIDDVENERATKRRKVQHKVTRMANGNLGRVLSQRFNYSNDVAYEALRENNSNKIRATLLNIPVDHAVPAQKLQFPFYRTKLKSTEPFSYHRPVLEFEKGTTRTPVKLAKPAFVKKKALKGKKIPEIFKKAKDMSMNDNSTSVLLEYCEEIPTILSNFGMGQRIMNYYRRDKGADTRPEKQEIGETSILLPEDRSPFSIFGQINPGETVPTLHNAMYRAPIFKQKQRPTTFLMGRSHTDQNGSEWYLRNIDHLYVVGQTLPIMEIQGPHSRKATNIGKNRLRMVVFRLLHKSDHVTLSDIIEHVTEKNESQNRQKLKEFLRFRKDTKDWTLPPGEELLSKEAIDALVRPEDVCMMDAIAVGSHELNNSNSNKLTEDDPVVDDNSPDALDKKMLPWVITKNFIDASHGKAMLAVHGPGDPTGRGLGISFIKTSMKGGYLEQLQGPLATSADAIERQRKANGGHMYNVKNQDSLYLKSLTDIWNRQRESLQDATEHDDDDFLAQEDEDDRFNVNNGKTAVAPAPTPAPEAASQISRSAASGATRRKMKITRKIKDANGQEQTVSEIVHDPIVIAKYAKRRRLEEMAKIDVYSAELTGDPEKDALIIEMASIEQSRLFKNKERRQKREKQKKLVSGAPDGGSGDEGSVEPTTEKAAGTTRKCANCGQVGHIKTNKKLCPLLNGTIKPDKSQEDTAGLGSLDAPLATSFNGD